VVTWSVRQRVGWEVVGVQLELKNSRPSFGLQFPEGKNKKVFVVPTISEDPEKDSL